MREQRWQAHGAVESQRPTNSQIIEVDTDEDVVLPAQGGGRTKEYGDEPGVASGPVYDDPDFGDEEELMSLRGSGGAQGSTATEGDATDGVQPFAGLPEFPDDLADAFEALKLAVLRHKTAGWEEYGRRDHPEVSRCVHGVDALNAGRAAANVPTKSVLRSFPITVCIRSSTANGLAAANDSPAPVPAAAPVTIAAERMRSMMFVL